MSFMKNIGIKPLVGGIKPESIAPQPAVKQSIGIKPGIPSIKPTIKPNVSLSNKDTKTEEVDDKTNEKTEISLEPKKATIAPPIINMPKIKVEKIKETPSVEENTKNKEEDIIEEEITKEEITEEETIEIEKEDQDIIEKENKQESEQTEEHPREIALEEAKQEELVYGEYTLEEWNGMSPQKRAAITRKKNQESKEKSNNKSTQKQESSIKAKFEPTLLPQRSTADYEELIANLVITSLGDEWDEMVDQVRAKLKSIQITPDMNATTMKQATAELATLRDELFYDASQSKTVFEGVIAKIDVVKGLNAKGSSPDERKLNSLKACVHYSENGYDINLYELLEAARVKHNFYSEVMKQIEYKKNALITMNGALKIEKDLLGAN